MARIVLPTIDTVWVAHDHMADYWSINASLAPIVLVPGLVLCAGAALGLSTFLADTAAFRKCAVVLVVLGVSPVYCVLF